MANRIKPQFFGLVAGQFIEIRNLSPHLLQISCTLDPDLFTDIHGIREIVFSIEDSDELTFDLNHNLNTYNVSINHYDNVTKEDLFIDSKKIDRNTVRLSFNSPPSNIISVIRGKLEE